MTSGWISKTSSSRATRSERFTTGMTRESFVADERTYDAVLRNLEVVGEAAKRVPDALRAEMPDVPWRAIAGFRDFVGGNESVRLPRRRHLSR